MPELPEVETTLRGIAPHINHRTIAEVALRETRLRRPVCADLPDILRGETLGEARRRAKYLLLPCATGFLLMHLGMSGSLRIILPADDKRLPEKHDHVDIVFTDGTILRYRDPRRFGLMEWYAGAEEFCPPLQKLGSEPLSADFHAAYLHDKLAARRCAIKIALMNAHIVVGVGNIYANEALFRAGIHPQRRAESLSKKECQKLVKSVQTVLQQAIEAGGSSLRDFVHSDGSPGYFQQQYAVYARTGEPCLQCATPIAHATIGQRSSFYCPHCQPHTESL
ncbi:MAG: bifunctional DNA-formamidopyrimidine glycosylase/DNA-(apurinic or apyrimidinic site) lyase [Neisseria sp.]|nr:bifunctional DNA-formamidopyrimidine glycosylase/DNA-(apurinic or apyrimidinic site) lyase [Neisseria sp.]